MGITLSEMPVWDPNQEIVGGNTAEAIRCGRVILWNGYCGVHQAFLPEHVAQFRAKHPQAKIIVHPECMREVVEQADMAGSTSQIIRVIEQSPAGAEWAIGTEMHLVNRLRASIPTNEYICFSWRPACVRRCIASTRDICVGRWRTWRRARR